ncbi:MAG: DegV family protein [Christensenellaceae bacterium]|jgi:DegV family protein with EDD domain
MIVIATDSSAYLTRQEAKELKVVHIPMTYTIEEASFAETFILENESFQRAIEIGAGNVITSQPTMDAFERRFKRLVDAGCEVLCLTISSRLSGTYNNAKACAAIYGEQIKVIDTKLSAGSLYLLICAVKEKIDRGASFAEVIAFAEEEKKKIESRFSVRDLMPLRKSGRLGFIRQSIGTILNQRPILALENGTVVCVGTARGENDQIRKLIDAVPENAKKIVVEYFNEKEMAEKLKAHLEKKLGKEVMLRRIGLVLGVHLGYDVVGICWENV